MYTLCTKNSFYTFLNFIMNIDKYISTQAHEGNKKKIITLEITEKYCKSILF